MGTSVQLILKMVTLGASRRNSVAVIRSFSVVEMFVKNQIAAPPWEY